MTSADLDALIAKLALDYHKTVEGEYGCGYPQTKCPGVLRLITLLQSLAALLTRRDPPEPLTPQQSQQEFEYWMRANNPDMSLARGDENDSFDYVNAFVETAWEGWRAGLGAAMIQAPEATRRDAPQEPHEEDSATRVEPLSSASTVGIYRGQSPGAVTAAERTEKL